MSTLHKFTFTKLKPFKLWAELQRMSFHEIEDNLKLINKHGRTTIVFRDSKANTNTYKSPIPNYRGG